LIRFSILLKRKKCKAVAEQIGISATYLSSIINERRLVTAKMALKLEKVLGLDSVDLMQRSAKLAVELELAKSES